MILGGGYQLLYVAKFTGGIGINEGFDSWEGKEEYFETD